MSVASLLRNVQIDSLSMEPISRYIISDTFAADIEFYIKKMKAYLGIDYYGSSRILFCVTLLLIPSFVQLRYTCI